MAAHEFTDPTLRGPEKYYDYLKMATEKSLERCQTSKFDLLMLHNPDSISYTSDKVWDAFTALKTEGLTDRLGIAPGPARKRLTLDMIECFERFGDRMGDDHSESPRALAGSACSGSCGEEQCRYFGTGWWITAVCFTMT